MPSQSKVSAAVQENWLEPYPPLAAPSGRFFQRLHPGMMSLPFPTGRTLVLFTDLDGTLIDHHTYGTEGSRAALQKLTGHAVPKGATT